MCVLWIAFNAAYAVDRKAELALSPGDTTEAQRQSGYFGKLVPLDMNRQIYNVLATELRAPVQDLMQNVYVYWGFWDCLTEQPFDWRGWANRARFERDRDLVAVKLGYGPASGTMQAQLRTNAVVPAGDVIRVLRLLFDRLNVLRNQLMHGCATQDGSLNRSQVDAGATILAALVPVFLDVMAEEPRQDWGAIAYPVRDDIREDRHDPRR